MRSYVWYKFIALAALLGFSNNPANAELAWLRYDGANKTPALFQFNSSGGLNGVSRSRPGRYHVRLPGLTASGRGVVHVTAFNSDSYCMPERTDIKGPDRRVVVGCFGPNGVRKRSPFTLLFINKPETGPGDVAYVQALQATKASYKPGAEMQWNYFGKKNSVRRLGLGHYRVRFPENNEQIEPGGTMLVTAFGGELTRCQAGDWLAGQSAIESVVYCFASDGRRVDSPFNATFVRRASFGKVKKAGRKFPNRGSYVWAHAFKKIRAYMPAKKFTQYDDVTVRKTKVGEYRVRLRGITSRKPSKNGVFVSVYGSKAATCNIRSWQDAQRGGRKWETIVAVHCYNLSGQPVDAQFTLLYQTNDPSPTTRRKKSKSGPRITLEPADGYMLQNVYFGTDRADRGPSEDVLERYTGERSRTGEISYGVAKVSIPHDHRMGQLEQASRFSLRGTRPESHVALQSIDELTKRQFLQTVRAVLAATRGRKKALIYIHGFNVSFADAAQRTAQMAYDLEFDGPVLFYSWPSHARGTRYVADESNIEWATPHIRDFVKDVIKTTGVQNVHLIAHSMGTRGLTGALRDQRNGLRTPDFQKIRSIMLAAPDIDADIFIRDIAPEIQSRSNVTVYASDNDRALSGEEFFLGTVRAGVVDNLRRNLPADIDVIDASDVSTDVSGHSYYANNESIISDMKKIFAGRTNKADRCHLTEVTTDAGKYWEFNEGPCGVGE